MLLRGGELSLLDEAPLQANILWVLQFCFEHSAAGSPMEIYRHYPGSASTVAMWSNSDTLLDGLVLKGLVYTPGNVIFFSRLSPGKTHSPLALREVSLKAQVPRQPRLVKALIQASNDTGSFAVEAMRNILREAKSMSITFIGKQLSRHASLWAHRNKFSTCFSKSLSH